MEARELCKCGRLKKVGSWECSICNRAYLVKYYNLRHRQKKPKHKPSGVYIGRYPNKLCVFKKEDGSICGKPFTPTVNFQKYCPECRWENTIKNQVKWICYLE